MKTTFFTLFVCCCFLLFACANQNPANGSGNPTSTEKPISNQNLNWTVLHKGGMSAQEQAKQMVITNPTAFTTLWNETFANIMNPIPEIPKVDFAQHIVVAAFMGIVNTGGHEIAVKSAEVSNGEAVVTLLYRKPANNCPVTDAMANPCLFISLPINLVGGNKIDVRVETVTVNCE